MRGGVTGNLRRVVRGAAFWALVTGVAWVMGSNAAADVGAAPGQLFLDQLDFFKISITALFGFAIWSARRILLGIDKKIDLLFSRTENTERELARLQGEHDARTEPCTPLKRRRGD